MIARPRMRRRRRGTIWRGAFVSAVRKTRT
jgi:hypothetical protein